MLFAFLQYGQYDLEKMTTLWSAMAFSTTSLVEDMAVLGEENARLEKKTPAVRLYILRNMVRLRELPELIHN